MESDRMEWFASAFWAKLGWVAGEVALGFFIVLTIGLLAVPRLVRQARCRHELFFETGACNAVCTNCGKNLGFIGAWRDKIAAHKH